MKALHAIPLLSVLLLPAAGLVAGPITAEFEDVRKFTDFSVNGLSEEKTLVIFQSELEDELQRLGKKYLKDDQSLVIRFTDIDMAGDIQPWRNRHNADIRYIEAIYPPRLKFHYTLKGADDKVIDEGDASISDLAFQMNAIASMKTQFRQFYYETELLGDWMRQTFRQDKSAGRKK